MNRINRILLASLVASLSGAASGTVGEGGILVPAWSPDITLTVDTTLVQDEDAAISSDGGVSLVVLGGLPPATDLDALQLLADGDVLFSTDTTIVLGETLFRPCDVVRFDGASWTKEFDCQAEGLPAGVNVDAVALFEAQMLLSLDVSVELDGRTFDDADVIAFDGGAFSVFFDAAMAGVDIAADVDAVHVEESGRTLLSFDVSGQLGGISFADEDVLAWEASAWSLAFDGSGGDPTLPADLDAWSFAVIADLLFMDGFE